MISVERRAGRLGNDSKAFDRTGIRSDAVIPETGKADRRLAFGRKEPFSLLPLLSCPFIPSLGRHQATLALKGIAEGAAGSDRLRAGVKGRKLELLQATLVPPRQEPPAGGDHLDAIFPPPKDRRRVGWADFRARLQVRRGVRLGEAQRQRRVAEFLDIAAIGLGALII